MEFEEHAADPLAGGMMQGYQCGMLWGAALAAGAQAYRLFGAGPQAEAMAISAAQGIVASFRAQNKSIDCREITGIDMSSASFRMIVRFLVKTGLTGSCFGMAARYARAAFGEICTTFSEKHVEALPGPVSCSAMLAQEMGVSDLHTVMAAGFAGGIGLSGSGCGALGAAIWIAGTKILENGGKVSFKASHASDMLARFAECTDHEFECSRIAGRKFADVADHAGYLRDGGCSEIIKVLVEKCR